ncbi:MAG: hypothetical protein NC293_03955 [Roseburia sp.]|nr:hypothetical protein [Roseburia sp.]
MTKKMFMMGSLLLVCLAFVGCGSSNAITGTWQNVERNYKEMHFYEDGTCLDVYKNHTSADATNWKIQEDGMLILELEWDGNATFERTDTKEEALEDRDLYYLSGDTLVFNRNEYERKE